MPTITPEQAVMITNGLTYLAIVLFAVGVMWLIKNKRKINRLEDEHATREQQLSEKFD